MSKIGVKLKIDVKKIDKNLLYKGQKGTYLNAVVFVDIDQTDEYDNNGMITQDVGKDNQGNILGNCRVFWKDNNNRPQVTQRPAQQAPAGPPSMDAFDDDIPF